jgi:hypothetical protein
MALNPCRQCGQQISTSASPCPHCGRALPHGLSWITKAAIGGLCPMLGLVAVVLVLAPKSAPSGAPVVRVASRPSAPPAAGASAVHAQTEPGPTPAGRVLVKQVITEVGAYAGKKCEAMAGEPQSCRFLASEAFPFMVKIVAETAPITPQSLTEQVVVMFPGRIPDEHLGTAMILMLSMARVANVALHDKGFYSQLVIPGHRKVTAQSGGTSRIDVEGSSAFNLATVTRPH